MNIAPVPDKIKLESRQNRLFRKFMNDSTWPRRSARLLSRGLAHQLLIAALVLQLLLVPVNGQSRKNSLVSTEQLARMDGPINEEISKKQLPGDVVLIGRNSQIVWRKAYGAKAVEPAIEPMTVDTIFDLASLTKVVATTTSIMILVERGKIRLNDPVSAYIPELKGEGRDRKTIRLLRA